MLWWWRFAFASGMTDALLVGKEREFLSWFYRNNTFKKVNFDEETLTEYYRTFQGKENINGAFGVYRAIFETIDQTEKYLKPGHQLPMPVMGLAVKVVKATR